MKTFVERFGSYVVGVLNGFDRLRFRGSKRQLCHVTGLVSWLGAMRMLYKDYKLWAKDASVQVCQAIEGPAERAGIYRFLNNSHDSKEQAALEMAARHKRSEGLVAVLGCVEPCQVMQMRGHPDTKRLEVRVEPGKCKHYYRYVLDPRFGLRYTRLQSWLPFTMHAGLNGREWLARQMDRAGLEYLKKDNCFPWLADFKEAQRLADRQLATNWPKLLDRWAKESFPKSAHAAIFRGAHGMCPVPYYWSVDAAEYATDIAFSSADDLARLYPRFVQHSIATLQSADLLRFMGYKLRPDGAPHRDFAGEATTRIKELVEGICVKHRVRENQVKMYDKFGEVLRLETMLHDVRDFKVLRTTETNPDGPLARLRMRKGVADLHARADVSRKINERLAESLATVEEPKTLAETTDPLGQRQRWHGRVVRPLNPLADADVALLEAVSRGEFMIAGFRNRDLRALLYPNAATATAAEQKRLSAKVTRQLRLLRGHSIIAKIAATHRYQLTERGRTALSALLAARNANIKQLLQAA